MKLCYSPFFIKRGRKTEHKTSPPFRGILFPFTLALGVILPVWKSHIAIWILFSDRKNENSFSAVCSASVWCEGMILLTTRKNKRQQKSSRAADDGWYDIDDCEVAFTHSCSSFGKNGLLRRRPASA